MKTIEQLVDENPDATPEQITELMTQQPYVEAMAPAPKGPAATPNEIVEQKEPSGAMQIDVAAVPPRVSEQARVAKLYSDRNNLEEGLQKDIEREEDTIRETKGSVGTEAALAAGGKVLAGTLGKMLNYDASPQVKGFEDAEKSIAGRTDENKQRREFLKERLYRADNPTKRMLDDLKARGAVRDNSLAEEMDPLRREKALVDAEADIQDSRNRYTKGQGVAKQRDAKSADYKMMLLKKETQLKGLAEKDGPYKDVAAEILKDPDALRQMDPDNRAALLDDMFKTEKDAGGEFKMVDLDFGNKRAGFIYNSKTGKYEKLGEGVKPPGVGSGNGASQDDKDMKELAKRLEDKNAISNAFSEVKKLLKVSTLKDPSLRKRDLPGVSIPGIGRVTSYSKEARELDAAILSITGPLSNARYGASQTNTELRKLATELAEGKFNTESEKIDALARLEELNDRAIAEDKAGFKPEVVQTYEGRQQQEKAKLPSTEAPKKSWRDLVGGK